MTNPQFVHQIFLEMLSEFEQTPPHDQLVQLRDKAERKAIELEQQKRNDRISDMLDKVYELIDLLVRMESLAEADDMHGFEEARIEMCRITFDLLSDEQKKLIWDPRQRKRASKSGDAIGETWTDERKRELDQTVKRGKSGIYGMRLRQRDGWKDRGTYSNQVCLITRHGWAPVVVPGGIEELLRRLEIWGEYKDKWPQNSKPVPFRQQHRFVIEWERLEDGTRSFVRVVAQ